MIVMMITRISCKQSMCWKHVSCKYILNKLTLSYQSVLVELCSEIEQRIYQVMHFEFTQTRNKITLV